MGTSKYIYIRGNLQCDNEIYCTQFPSGGNDRGYWRLCCPDIWIRLQDGSGNHRNFTDQEIYEHTNLYGNFTSISQTNNDHLVVEGNTGSIGQGLHGSIKSGFGTFTGFHRSYTDDILYDEENVDIFKNNYMGRVVITTGKIKTDLTRKIEPTEPEPVHDIKKTTESEWYSLIDKDGITIEDVVPVVALSRKKEYKRVFGLLGSPNRNTNNKNRLIVNSVGEGAICVANTTGNIDNSDYL